MSNNINIIYNSYVTDLQALQNNLSMRGFSFEGSIAEVQGMQVHLSPTPENNLLDFNEIYAKSQAYFDRVTSILIDMQAELSFWKSALQDARGIMKRARMLLIVNDSKVLIQKNLSLQEAYIESQVPDIVFLIHEIEKTVAKLKDYTDIALLKRDSLDKLITTQGKQQRVVESLITLGYTTVVGVRHHEPRN